MFCLIAFADRRGMCPTNRTYGELVTIQIERFLFN